jgi:beta-mannosidase
MRYIPFFVILMIIVSGCTKSPVMKNTLTQNIDQNWYFKEITDTARHEATVPGTVHTDLLGVGLIEDPFYRTNERDLQWIDKKDWEYRSEFEVSEEIMGREEAALVFYGLDTYANVFLNDNLILESDNMFRTWEVDCKKYLRPGVNVLKVVLLSPTRIGLEKLEANGYPLPASNDQSENGDMGENRVSIFTRKAGYHYGWDWGPRLVTSGIWRPVELKAWDKVEITDIAIDQKTVSARSARFNILLEMETSDSITVDITYKLNNTNSRTESVDLHPGKNTRVLDFEIIDPKLWWPAGLGDPDMNTFYASVSFDHNGVEKQDNRELHFGLRDVKLVRKKDKEGDGESFYFQVNGVPVFARGANYIPNDVFLPRVDSEDYERIVQDAYDANMNMIRIWGGGIYENDIFYDLCDQYGIMVWQDFMYACSMYPGDDAFLENARIEAEENIKRLRNHPSVVLWCGNNENEVAWGEYEEGRGWGWKERYTPEQRKEIWKNYDTLFHQILPAAVQKLGFGIAYWHSSPSAGMGKLASYENNAGDMHYWGVWHGQHPFEDFRKYKARFMSEYGFQSFPELSTVAEYALPEEWDIESEVMAAHQRSGIGNLRIKQYMKDDYLIPGDFNHFLYVSQLLQAEGIKMAIKSHRAEMPYCMGSLYWQLNDCWPVASWSGIDYYGRWKAMHYFVKDAFKETAIAIFNEDDKQDIWLISDRLKKTSGILSLRLMDFNGTEIWSDELVVTAPANGSQLVFQKGFDFFEEKADLNTVMLIADLISADTLIDREIKYFVKPKDLSLPDPGIEVQVSEKAAYFEVSVTSEKLAKNVFLGTDLSTDHFSDNYFDLLPGQEKKVTYPKVADIEQFRDRLKVISLYQTINP